MINSKIQKSITLIAYTDSRHPYELRSDYNHNNKCIWVHSDVWNLLHSWYGGGPAFPRELKTILPIYRDNRNLKAYIVDHRQIVKLMFADDVTGEIDYEQFEMREYPNYYHLIDIVTEVK